MNKQEAIKILKEFHDTSALFSVRTALETVFPELKEGEDEKIRKTLIEYFNAYPKEYFGGLKKRYIVAWLEKQDGKYSGGTSKEWTINDAAILKELIDFLENGTAKLQHDLTRYANWLKIQFTPIEKQGEKKPIEWKDSDEKYLFWALLSIQKDIAASKINGVNTKDLNDCVKWLYSLKQRIGG